MLNEIITMLLFSLLAEWRAEATLPLKLRCQVSSNSTEIFDYSCMYTSPLIEFNNKTIIKSKITRFHIQKAYYNAFLLVAIALSTSVKDFIEVIVYL